MLVDLTTGQRTELDTPPLVAHAVTWIPNSPWIVAPTDDYPWEPLLLNTNTGTHTQLDLPPELTSGPNPGLILYLPPG
ncbi:MAG: hypothetical protein GY701_23810 [Sulfitobacter sp.]|nr:hypothetical protein [Sulfitobacter sp.]MCP3910565.1 hypothetical protein [Actinomycetes bacterium]